MAFKNNGNNDGRKIMELKDLINMAKEGKLDIRIKQLEFEITIAKQEIEMLNEIKEKWGNNKQSKRP